MYSLPTEINIKDKIFHIRKDGDFRMVIDCFSALQDEELSEDYRVLASLLIFYNEFNSIEEVISEDSDTLNSLILEMFKFMNGGSTSDVGAVRKKPVIDWEEDSQIICAGVNAVAKQEVRSLSYLHWWTFLGYYLSIGDSVLSTVVGIRDKINNHKKLDTWEKDFKKDNPRYFIQKQSKEEEELTDYIKSLWNSGD